MVAKRVNQYKDGTHKLLIPIIFISFDHTRKKSSKNYSHIS